MLNLTPARSGLLQPALGRSGATSDPAAAFTDPLGGAALAPGPAGSLRTLTPTPTPDPDPDPAVLALSKAGETLALLERVWPPTCARRTHLCEQLAETHQRRRHDGVPEIRGRKQHPSNLQVNELQRKCNHTNQSRGNEV